ncbi:uncharacterized protein UTRI_02174_B [Ustilago trichophora]|uniref:Uncharacterized protein n=1 Tax=Ustilago trichophora TaxID=86804 RepID=A0A5C3DY74_9BASI|nr:uncharacterized protein UTRI_02174_B [Ustilago trichophora]
MPTLPSVGLISGEPEDETEEEAIMASLSSSPSRHPSSSSCLVRRGSSKLFGYVLGHRLGDGSSEDDHHHSVPSSSDSTPVSQQVSPWASTAVTPLSTPATSLAHGDLGGDTPNSNRTSEKKRLSWLGSTPASHWTMHRAPASSEASSPSSTCPIRSKRLHSRNGSWSSSSASSTPLTISSKDSSPKKDLSKRPSSKHAAEPNAAASLVPNAQFLGLMLLMILLISSPLIKILSVLLFVAVVVLDPSDSYI